MKWQPGFYFSFSIFHDSSDTCREFYGFKRNIGCVRFKISSEILCLHVWKSVVLPEYFPNKATFGTDEEFTQLVRINSKCASCRPVFSSGDENENALEKNAV